MNELKDKLVKIISNEVQSAPDDDDSFDIFEESIEKILDEQNRDDVLVSLLEILKDKSISSHWYLASSVVSWVVEESSDLPFEWSYLVAVLYVCLEQLPSLGVSGPADGDNLVWSIAHSVKELGYMDDWNPLDDSDVLAHMSVIKQVD